MPSFLSKLLGRKKVQEESESSTDKRGYPTSLLEGKFEAVTPTVSPSAAFFTDPGAAQIRGNFKSKESPFNLLRYKSRPSSDSPTTEKPADIPQLSLSLPVTKDHGRALDVVFESGNEATALLNEAHIGERRLSPDETLSLVRTCSQVVVERGLETLGIMHPHWHSASPEVQHRLVSLYILSLASRGTNLTASPTTPTPATFETELHYTRSPHDIAAVLRWGLRHLKLDGASFGKESGDWTWYNTFATAERTGSYPPDAFSKSLIPQLPAAHAELLLATLDIISSLSAHSEVNGSSGSKLSRFLGLWLLTTERFPEGDDWSTFYERWDRAGRILEHLFLARIRDEAHELPRRLTALVEHYPYASDAEPRDDHLLPRPRFSTRDYDALFVCLDTEYNSALKPKLHPLRLVADAFRAQSAADSASVENAGLWDTIKKASLILDPPEGTSHSAQTEPIHNFSNLFSEETIRLLSLIPVDVSDKNGPIPTPTSTLLSPISPDRSRSFSSPDSPRSPIQTDHGLASTSGQPAAVPGLNANVNTAPTTASPETPTDWLQFTNQGFGSTSRTRDLVATLWDSDVEVTAPPPMPLSRKSSRRAHSRRSSLDSPSIQAPSSPVPTAPAPPVSKVTLIARVKLNEAFIDFWADALLDPVSKPWLRFVLCELKPLPSVVTSPAPNPTWLVIEQRFVRQPLPKEEVEASTTPPRPRASSPRPSLRAETSRLSAAFSFSPKMRFGFLSGGSGDPKSPKEKTARLPLVGELGESVKETPEAVVGEGKPKGRDAGATDAGAAAPATPPTAAAAEEVPPADSTQSAPPALADETAPSDSITKTDETKGGQPTATATPQNGHAQEEQRTRELETAAQVPVSDGVLHSLATTESAMAETESAAPEAKSVEPGPESVPPVPYLAGISEGLIPQAERSAKSESVPAAETAPASDEVFASPSASADEPTLADEPSASDKDGVDVAPAVGTAENFPVAAEASVETDVLQTLEPSEHLGPGVMHEQHEELLHANGSVQPAISDEVTTTNASVVTEMTPVDEPVVEESVVTPKEDGVVEQLATSELEPLVEGATATALEEAVPISEGSTQPIPVEMEASPVVEESDLVTVDPPSVGTDALAAEGTSHVVADSSSAAEVVLFSSQTTCPPATAEVIVITETSIPAPAGKEPIHVVEAPPVAETPVETPTQVIPQSSLVPQTDVPAATEIPVETPAEELHHLANEVAPVPEIPVESPAPADGESDSIPDATTSVSVETQIPAAAVEENIPVVEEVTPSVEITVVAAAEEPAPVSQGSVFTVLDTLVETPTPTVEHSVPVTEEIPQAATTPIETSALVAEEDPVAEETLTTEILVTDEAAHAAETAAEIRAPATEGPDQVSQAAAPAAEPGVITEKPVPATEEPTPVTEEIAPAADTHTENVTLVVQEPTPAPPVVEHPIPAAEAASNDAPTEALVEAILVVEAPPSPSETSALVEPASVPEPVSHIEAPPPVTEAPAASIPEEHFPVNGDAVETPSESISPITEEPVPSVPEGTAPGFTETSPDVNEAPMGGDPLADTPLDVPVPVADEPAPTLEQSVSPVAETPVPVPEEPASGSDEEAVPAVVEHPAETAASGEEPSALIPEQATLATTEIPAAPIAPTSEESTVTAEFPLEAGAPTETPAPVPGKPASEPEQSAPEVSAPPPDAEEPPLQQETTAPEPEDLPPPPPVEHLSDQPETIVVSLPAAEQVVQEPVPQDDGETPATTTEEEPVAREIEPVAEAVVAPEVDAPVGAPASNGTGGAHHDDSGRESEAKLETDLDPDEQLEGTA